MIRFEHVKKSFGTKTVLKDVNFTVNNGKITSLVGKNGAGKSTTINIASKFMNPTTGTVENDSISVMPDADNLYQNMTGKHFLKFMSNIKNNYNDKIIKELTTDLGLTNDLNKKIKEYSFGMKKKISFIQTYIGNYDNYIFDEPTSGVDYESAKTMMSYLRKLANNDKAILMTSHNLNEIEEISDSVTFLSNGKTINKQRSSEEIASFILTVLNPNDYVLTKIGFEKVKDNMYRISLPVKDTNLTINKIIKTNIIIQEFKLEKSHIENVLDNIQTPKH